MATKREKLEKQAEELGLSFVPDTTDDELQQLIADFQDEQDDEDTKYYRSNIHALSVVVGDPDPTKGEVAHPTVDFVPFWVQQKGVQGPGPDGAVKLGFLKTKDGSAQKKLAGDTNVTEISKTEYEQATTAVFDEADQQIGGFRAPY